MPAAQPLVDHWLRHLMQPGDAGWLLDFYHCHKDILGKPFPRLEKLEEDAVAVYGEPVLALLNIFRDVPPNANHVLVADYLARRRGWAVTTNFDTAIEAAMTQSQWPGRLPVHTPEQPCDAAWGLIKLHGSIDEPLPRLGYSICNLVHGLAPHLAEAIAAMLDCSAIAVQHRLNAGFQCIEMPIDHGGNCLRIDFAEVVVHQDVAKAADVAPGDIRPGSFLGVGKVLGGFGERLQVCRAAS